MPFTVTNKEDHSQGDLRAVSATLTFGRIADESLADANVSNTTNWAGTTDWSDTIAGSTTYTHSGGTGLLTQTNANQTTVAVASRLYRLTYTVSAVSGTAPGCTITNAYAASAVTVAVGVVGTFTIDFTTATGAASADFVLSATSSTTGSFTLTQVSVKQVPEYPALGESLSPQELGLGQFVGPVEITQGQAGYTFNWDSTNEKIIVKTASHVPQLIVDEVVTMTSDAGTLAFPPAYIVSIVQDDNADPSVLSQVYRIVGAGKVAVDNVSVAIDFTTGGIVNIAADAPAFLRVTYFPQRPGTFFSKENLVIDEVIVPSATPVNLDFKAAAIQYVAGDTTPILFDFATSGDAPDAGEATLNMDDGNGGTTIDFNATDVTSETTCTVTYLKAQGLGGDVKFLDDTERAAGSEAFNWVTATFQDAPLGDNSIVVPGLGTHFYGEQSDDTQENMTITSFQDVDGNNVCTWNARTSVLTTDQTSAVTKSAMSWLKVQPQTGAGAVEISTPQDLSTVSIQVYARGR